MSCTIEKCAGKLLCSFPMSHQTNLANVLIQSIDFVHSVQAATADGLELNLL